MNVDLELFLFTYSLPYPSPSIQHRRDPPNTTHVVGFIYSRRTGKGDGEKKRNKGKNREELSVALVRTVLSSSSAALRACHAIYAGVCGDAPAVLFSEKFVSPLTSHHKCAATFSDKCNWIRWKPSAVQNGKNSNPVNSLTEEKKYIDQSRICITEGL